jgi:chloramphenicol 3-O phosphotransferase
MAATVILLNGAGSAGKSSLARALQNVLSEPWLHVALDSFLEMFPDRFHDDPEGFLGRNEIDEDKPQIAIEIGAAGRRLLKGMRLSVAAMAGAGNNLIVDDVILDGGLSEYEALLSEIRFLKVGVFAPLAVLEDRELKRGDRMLGLSRWQFPRVHVGVCYDLEVDTSLADPVACANGIASHFGLQCRTDRIG